MHVESRRDDRKQRDVYNTTDHLSAPPSSISDSDLLGVGETEARVGGHRLVSRKTSSDVRYAVFAISATSLWDGQVGALDAINSARPLVNLKESSFVDLHHVQIAHTTLDCRKIPTELNFTTTKHNLLRLFTKFPRGSCYAQINVSHDGERFAILSPLARSNIGLRICYPLPQ